MGENNNQSYNKSNIKKRVRDLEEQHRAKKMREDHLESKMEDLSGKIDEAVEKIDESLEESRKAKRKAEKAKNQAREAKENANLAKTKAEKAKEKAQKNAGYQWHEVAFIVGGLVIGIFISIALGLFQTILS